MKILILMIFTHLIFANSICEIEGVKGFKFGMSKDEARANDLVVFKYSSEKAMLTELGFNSFEEVPAQYKDVVQSMVNNFSTSFSTYSGDGSVFFSDKGLKSFVVSFDIDTRNNNKYIEAYFEIKNLLTKKYGKPTNIIESLQYPYEDDYPMGDHAGTAISIGKGSYYSQFKCDTDDNIYINLSLKGDNYKMSFHLAYVNNNFDLPAEEKEKKILDEF